MDIRQLREAASMSRPKFAKYFDIPYRTVQSWEVPSESNARQCPDYLIDLMKYKLEKEGYLK